MSTFAEIQSKIQSGLPSQEIDLGDNKALLTVAEAAQLVAAGVHFAAGDAITILDAAENIEAVDANGIASLATMGAASLVATDRGLELDLSQINAIANGGLSVTTRYESVTSTQEAATLVNNIGSFYPKADQSVVVLANEGYVVTWRSSANQGDVHVQLFDTDGNKRGGDFTVHADVTRQQTDPTITALSDGGFVVAWQGRDSNGAGVYLQRFDADGNRLGGETLVNTQITGEQQHPTIVALAGGGYAVTWLSYGSNLWSATAQVFGANGQPVGGELTLGAHLYEEGMRSFSVKALSNGSFVFTWMTEDLGVEARIVAADGTIVGSLVTAGSEKGYYPEVTALSGGRFVLAWTWEDAAIGQSGDVRWQMFDDQGNRIGDTQTANTDTTDRQADISIAATADGGFVATWLSFKPATSVTSLHAQKYDAQGNPVGGELTVAAPTPDDMYAPKITALPDGGFAVAWATNSDSGESHAYFQIFGRDGGKIGNAIRVGTESNAQREPSITVLANADILITWLSDSSNGSSVLSLRLAHDTEKVSLKGTASAVNGLMLADIANFAELGVQTFKVSDGGDVRLSKAILTEMRAMEGFKITGAGSVTLMDTGHGIEALSVTDIVALKTLGVTSLEVSDNKITLSLDQAMAYLDAGITLASGDVATVEMTFLELVALISNINALVAFGMKIIDLTENEITLGLVGYRYLDSIGVRFAASDVLTLTDYKFNIVNLTVAEIAELAEWGITKIDTNAAETEPAVLSLAQVKAFAAGGISFAADELVHLSDGVAALSSLSAGDIADLAAVGVSKVVVEQALALTVSQFTAYAEHGIDVQSLNGIISVHDAGANFAALAADGIAGLSALGITILDVTDNKVVLSLAAIKAYAAADAHFASDDRVVMGVTAASLSATSASDLALAKAFGVAAITTTQSSLDLAVATAERVRSAGLSLDSDFTARIADTAANLLSLSFQDVSSYREMGVDGLRLVDSGSVIAGLSLANIANLAGRSVSEVDVTNGAVTLTLAQANQFAASEIVFAAADTIVVTASSASLSDPDTLDLIGLAAIHVDRIDASDNKLTLTLAAAQTYVSAGIGFTAADTVTVKISYAEAKTLSKATGSALHAAGVDRVEIDMTANELKALTYTELKAFVAAGVDGITGLTTVTFSNLTYDLVTHTANYNPVITSNGGGVTASITIAENTKAVTTVRATDKEAATLTYSIVGGADKAFFTIDARTGALVFKAAPDYETPKDSGKNNVYDLIVQVSDGRLIDTQALAVSVKDVNEAPTVPTLSGTAVKENVATGTLVGTFASKDPDGKALSYKLLDTAGGLFKLSGSKLVTAKAIDYEKVQKDTVTIEVFDGLHKVTKVFTITVTDILETITGTAKGEVLKGGIGMDRIVGLAGNDTLHGYAGNDILEGGDGNDVLIGGAGADRLLGGNGLDTASYAGAKAGVVASLAKPSVNTGDAKGDTYSSIENLTGSSYADRLTGDTKANVIDGGAGDDVLSGGAGNDRLVGGLGFDDLYGGTGSDRFVFRSVKELGTSKTVTDTLFDFSQKEKDLIDFTAIDANLNKAGDQAFNFIGAAKFSNAAGELRYEKTKADTYVYGDIDGNGKADFVLHIDVALNLKTDDFLL
ncbi:M10 family metallopeptidase C-terminal domain-containing protein [Shinella sp. M27]|uniref:M10 family metallopeptidase C-terminal domain-containing protein n=1 Tax=Shinella sp. M27 TaxID=3368614 RepID=UPI003BA23B4C